MGQRLNDHYYVTRAGVPQRLVVNSSWASKGVLVACEKDEPPTKFLCSRLTMPRYATIYARRKAEQAIRLTIDLIQTTQGSLADEHPFLAALYQAPLTFRILAVKCPKKTPELKELK